MHAGQSSTVFSSGMYRQGQYDIDKVTKEFYIKEECDGNVSVVSVFFLDTSHIT